MTSEQLYHEAFEELKNIYLEDSWVLDVKENKNSVSFEMEFVLTENHELYSVPKKNEQYCYKKGQLNISHYSSKYLQKSKQPPSIDANHEIDFGNIDVFTKNNEQIKLLGDWGQLLASSANVSVEIYPGEAQS